MDRKTALAITNLILLRRLAKTHGITDPEDIIALAAMVAVSAEVSGVSFGNSTVSLNRAPEHIVESLKYVLDAVRKQADEMLADPKIVKTIEDKADQLGV